MSPWRDPADDLLGIGSSAASGALAGSAFGLPGTVIGGLVGAGLGTVGTIQQNKAEKEALEEQARLKAKIANAPDYQERLLKEVGASSANRRRGDIIDAESAANRAGLINPGDYVSDAMQGINEAQASQMPGIINASEAATEQYKMGLINREQQLQQLMDSQYGADYLGDISNMMQAGAMAAGSAKDYGKIKDAEAQQEVDLYPYEKSFLQSQDALSPAVPADKSQLQYNQSSGNITKANVELSPDVMPSDWLTSDETIPSKNIGVIETPREEAIEPSAPTLVNGEVSGRFFEEELPRSDWFPGFDQAQTYRKAAGSTPDLVNPRMNISNYAGAGGAEAIGTLDPRAIPQQLRVATQNARSWKELKSYLNMYYPEIDRNVLVPLLNGNPRIMYEMMREGG